MVTQHSAIVDPNIHEPKGVDSAGSGRVYFSDGSGSGTWSKFTTLVEDRALTGLTAEEWTGLSSYTALYIVILNITAQTAGDYLLLQLSTASTYRTSGYLDAACDEAADTVTDTDGTAIRVGLFETSALSGFGVIEINNFNNASGLTTVKSNFTCVNSSYQASSTPSTTQNTASYFGFYPTAEAHEKFKLLTTSGDTMSSGNIQVYGVR